MNCQKVAGKKKRLAQICDTMPFLWVEKKEKQKQYIRKTNFSFKLLLKQGHIKK